MLFSLIVPDLIDGLNNISVNGMGLMMLIFDTISIKDNDTVWRLPGDTSLNALRYDVKTTAASVASCLHALIQSKIFFRNMVINLLYAFISKGI